MGHEVWMYKRADNGEVSAMVFDSDNVPDGWVDSPDKAKASAPQPKKPESKKEPR